MSDRGRYDYDITTGDRSYGGRSGGERSSGGGFSRNSGSMFGMGGSRDRGRDEGDTRMGGSAGSGRTSAYDQNDRHRGGTWTEERENFSWGRGHEHHDQDRHEHRGRDGMQHERTRDRGERMSSGWGGLAGEDVGRDRMRDRDRHRGGRMGGGAKGGRDMERDRSRGYGADDHRDGLPIEETSRLIASNKVEGTAVYGRDGHRLGSIYNFMVDKLSGKVEYAVMRYGGMLGMGQRYYPLPWEILTYDTREGGYRIQMTERDLQDAPSFDRDTEPQFNRAYDEHVSDWYGTGRR